MNQNISNCCPDNYRNNLLILFVIFTIINVLSGWSIGYSDFENQNKELQYFYSADDRILGKIFHLTSLSLFFAAMFSFILPILD